MMLLSSAGLGRLPDEEQAPSAAIETIAINCLIASGRGKFLINSLCFLGSGSHRGIHAQRVEFDLDKPAVFGASLHGLMGLQV